MMLTYFIHDKLGGVTSLNFNLVANSGNKASQCVIQIDLRESTMTRANIHFPVEKEIMFSYTEKENYYNVLQRLRDVIPDEDGAFILNYDNEMAMLDHYPVRQTTFQLVHDDYNVTLAKEYSHVVDVFICHNTVIYKDLIRLLPYRESTIFYLPHGVPIPALCREVNMSRKLRLIFLGRMTASKGIFDLPVINELLREAKVDFEWICIGNGPELDDLKRIWNVKDKVTFTSPSTNTEVMALCATGDLFVLPTKFEGSPVSLLETMSVGLVPVVTAIAGGITDIVQPDIGYAIGMNDNKGFANAIIALNGDRTRLNQLSRNCRKKIVDNFDVKITACKYHNLFNRYREFYNPKILQRRKVGSRLDHPQIPGVITRLIRQITRE